MTQENLLEVASVILSWANEVADLTVGTLYEKLLNVQIDRVQTLLNNEDFAEARKAVFDLAQLADDAELTFA